MIQITANAQIFFDKQFLQHKKKYLHLSIKVVGCSGYQYTIVWQDEPQGELIAFNDWYLCSDPKWQHILLSVCIDLKSDNLGLKKIIFENPKTINYCGCGESFMIDEESK